MTQEEKAKAYDEAIKKAEPLYKAAEPMSGCNVIIETLFPELKKESEDERIRKEILDYIIKGSESYYDVQQYGREKLEKWIAWLEKPADKVEPKFKVGDWVVIDGEILHITNITEDGYSTEEGGHIPFRCEKDARLWTIQDAKDGDVLSYVTGEEDLWIMIYWSLYEPYEGHVYYHVLLVNDNFSDKGTCWICIDNLKPATNKEQRLLFQKMKEAGYEWDANKKELKKIEYKHICELDNSYASVRFPFKAKVKSSGTIVTIHDGQLSPDGKEWIKYQSDAEDRYKVYEPNNLELVCEIEQKPVEWSDVRFTSTVQVLEYAHSLDAYNQYGKEDIRKNIDWLKSLKDRVQPQPKQEWSEEDEKIRIAIFLFIESYGAHACYEVTQEEMLDWLKSLKDRYTWKPSKEHMEALLWCVAHLGGADHRVLGELYEHLKTLRGE